MPVSHDSHINQPAYLRLRIQAEYFAVQTTTLGGARSACYLVAKVRQNHASMKKPVAVRTIEAPDE